jgi:pimeloyl-ACP methyl ester carboxylesterase
LIGSQASLTRGHRTKDEEISRHTATLRIDRTVKLAINGSIQRVRSCAARTGLAPMLIVQAGPGLPLLHEVLKFQRRLHLESDFHVTYWDQRGCGNASRHDAESVSLQQQVDDLLGVVRWLYDETKRRVMLLGVSLGATFALQAAARDSSHLGSVIAISPDADTSRSDAAAHSFLQERCALATHDGLGARAKKLGEPPYVDSTRFQLRAKLLTDLGAIERGKTFNAILIETLFSMIRVYGPVGAVKALRNMNLIQGTLLPQLVSLNVIASPPRPTVPIHFVFGGQDALTPAAIVKELPMAMATSETTVTLVPDAGHMVHFDQPELVRSIALKAQNDP